MKNNFYTWCRHIFSILLDTGHLKDTETCRLDNMFPLDDILFGSDTE